MDSLPSPPTQRTQCTHTDTAPLTFRFLFMPDKFSWRIFFLYRRRRRRRRKKQSKTQNADIDTNVGMTCKTKSPTRALLPKPHGRTEGEQAWPSGKAKRTDVGLFPRFGSPVSSKVLVYRQYLSLQQFWFIDSTFVFKRSGL